MGGHHLILGKLTDFLTGEILDDTLDERYRQKIARWLVERKGYGVEEVEPRRELLLQADHRRAMIKIDFVVRVAGRAGMVVRFGPGSLVSRERPALAVSRLVEAYQVPIAVVTNGEDAEVLAADSGKVLGRGLKAIPSRAELLDTIQAHAFEPVAPQRAAMEARVAYCYEVDGACPCDDTVCRLS
jgi:Type I restriction enzyme R protein N terminus (HSDR_N)